MANAFYNEAKKQILAATLDLTNDTIKVMLIDNVPTYTFDPDDVYVDEGGAADVLDAEISGTGYTGGWGGSGRKTVSTKQFSTDNTNDRGAMDCDDFLWTSIDAGATGAAVVVREGGANDTTSLLIAYIDSGFPVTTNGGNLTLQVNSSGLFLLT